MAEYIVSMSELIEEIRKQERERLLREQEAENKLKPFTEVSRHIDYWGEEYEIPVRDLYKLKSAVHTIIRYSLGIRRMTDLKESQIELAKSKADYILEMIRPAINN